MADRIYNWGKEVIVKDDEGKPVKRAGQLEITEKGLKKTDIPVWDPPQHVRTISRGVYDYDPLGGM